MTDFRGTVSNYNIIKFLDEGGFGKVFLCSPMSEPDKLVAVKFSFGEGIRDTVNEYNQQNKLDH